MPRKLKTRPLHVFQSTSSHDIEHLATLDPHGLHIGSVGSTRAPCEHDGRDVVKVKVLGRIANSHDKSECWKSIQSFSPQESLDRPTGYM